MSHPLRPPVPGGDAVFGSCAGVDSGRDASGSGSGSSSSSSSNRKSGSDKEGGFLTDHLALPHTPPNMVRDARGAGAGAGAGAGRQTTASGHPAAKKGAKVKGKSGSVEEGPYRSR